MALRWFGWMLTEIIAHLVSRRSDMSNLTIDHLVVQVVGLGHLRVTYLKER